MAIRMQRPPSAMSPSATPAEFASYVAQEHRKWGEIAKRTEFKPLA